MDYDQMKAGDVLDAMVAERVMGWAWWAEVKSQRRGLFPPTATGVGNDGQWRRADGSEKPFEGRVGLIPAYSTDNEAALRVVERLRDHHGLGVHLEFDTGMVGAPCGVRIRHYAIVEGEPKTVSRETIFNAGGLMPLILCQLTQEAADKGWLKE